MGSVDVSVTLLVESLGFSIEQDRSSSLGHEERQTKNDSDCDEENPVDPPPVARLQGDPATKERS